ncbi:MAG: hypothetical protein MUF78_11610 [Candidatus Edwardsbacteria bacterium]|jgi:hypothetical protein|nr:hypothetical protein [Candidatus Edwardsbacteria bacterium]
MDFLKKLGSLDRRVVYLVLAVSVIVPLVFSFNLRHYVDRSTQRLFDHIEAVPPGGKAVLISFDYDPQVAAELDPMAEAVLRHCFARGIPVIGMSLYPIGASLGERIFTRVAQECGKRHGVDYCYMGYRPGYTIVIMGLGENMRGTFRTDHYGTPADSLPLLRNIRNYDDVALLLDLAGSQVVTTWIVYAGVQYHATVAAGLTAVSAPDYYPYLQTGQLVGQLGGMKGAAEYEQLNVERGYHPRKGLASRAMNAISVSHIVTMLLIIMGNIAFLAARRAGKRDGEGRAIQ